MANIIDSIGFLPSRTAQDSVGVFDKNYVQVFKDARAIRVRVNPSAKLMQHPAETGIIITDHRIINPIVIEMSLMIASQDYRNVYEQISQLFLNGDLLSVHTKAKVYDNQLIESLPHEESPEFHDTLLVALRLQQVQFVTSQYAVDPVDPLNDPTLARGTQFTVPDVPLAEADLFARIRAGV